VNGTGNKPAHIASTARMAITNPMMALRLKGGMGMVSIIMGKANRALSRLA